MSAGDPPILPFRELPAGLVGPVVADAVPERPTIRDQFAMAALTGLLASHLQQLTHTTAALNAWAIADAMMKERGS